MLASIYAGMSGEIDIVHVIVAAASGTIIGDNIGFGRASLWLPLVQRYGELVGLDEKRLLFGQHMFARHGAKIVFFWPLHRRAQDIRGAARRREPLFVARLPVLQRGRRHLLGDHLRHRRLFLRRRHSPRRWSRRHMIGLACAIVGLVAGWWIMRQQESDTRSRSRRSRAREGVDRRRGRTSGSRRRGRRNASPPDRVSGRTAMKGRQVLPDVR